MNGVNKVPASSLHIVGVGADRRRAQRVFTVANLDTGQVASTSLVPGSFTPLPTPGGYVVAAVRADHRRPRPACRGGRRDAA
ncbi:hypothetical protein [Solwaraspora sp. WMMD792]|uniref:hypothetical protein n=1 Tax=Solwaraspora sp. WMMD792 TaxID=3016099 RepID=UPI0024170822|nr:hypothetical protein [Solwaraspora sp. WMMD792]MDG4773706.1 hypothetical protein [Solwaraspora sp. WMMD792]